MPVYISLLRGINVGPHKRMKMDKLRESLESLGFTAVRTYIQSGNVIFKAAKLSPSALSRKIEDRISADFGFSVDVISRTRDEMGGIVLNNPLVREEPGIDPRKLHVAFLSNAPTAAALKKLVALTMRPDKARCAGAEIYLYFPNGVSGSSLWRHPLDRVLAVPTTMRNWNTVNKLYEMALACV
jgi:uncharacterized protein (DUF1697 family)